VEEHERERNDFDPTMFCGKKLWNRRPDGIVINKNYRILYILEFKRSSNRNGNFLGVKQDEANKHTKASPTRSKRLRLNRLILWQEGVVQ